jgi:hypothetical protein
MLHRMLAEGKSPEFRDNSLADDDVIVASLIGEHAAAGTTDTWRASLHRMSLPVRPPYFFGTGNAPKKSRGFARQAHSRSRSRH